ALNRSPSESPRPKPPNAKPPTPRQSTYSASPTSLTGSASHANEPTNSPAQRHSPTRSGPPPREESGPPNPSTVSKPTGNVNPVGPRNGSRIAGVPAHEYLGWAGTPARPTSRTTQGE